MGLFGTDHATELLAVLRAENHRLTIENDRLRAARDEQTVPVPTHPGSMDILPAGIENAIRIKFAFAPTSAALMRTAVAQQLRVSRDPDRVIAMIYELGEVVE